MNAWLDGWLAPGLWLLALWSLRWGILIAALAAWFWWRAPRAAAHRLLAARLVLLAGLALPLVPRLWGPIVLPPYALPSPRLVEQGDLAKAAALAPSKNTGKTTKAAVNIWDLAGRNSDAIQPAVSNADVNASEPAVGATDTQSTLGIARTSMMLVAMVWLIGMAIGLVRLLAAIYWLRRLCRGASEPSEACQVELQQACLELRITRRVVLGIHGEVAAPMLIGGLSARILVPAYWAVLAPATRRAILLHELAHVERRDDWSHMAEETVRACCWFHPLVHWLLGRIAADREELCDVVVVRQGIAPRALAEVLLECCRRCGPGRGSLALPAVMLPLLSRQTVKERIQFLMEEQEMSRWTLRPSRVLMFIGVLAAGGAIALVGGFNVEAQSAEPAAETLEQVPDAKDAKAELPTFAAIQAAYRENFRRLLPLEVSWQMTQADGIGNIESDRAEVRTREMITEVDFRKAITEHYRKELAGREFTGMERALVDQSVNEFFRQGDYYKDATQPKMVERRLSTRTVDQGLFWTDGNAFHRRRAKDGDASEKVELQPGPLTPPENLTKLYKNIILVSWSPDNQPQARAWYGSQGAIGTDAYRWNALPVVGLVQTKWREVDGWNELDRFMAGKCDEYQVVGPGEIAGTPLIIVDGFKSLPPNPGFRTRDRAWIDPAQGHLPLRWERASVDASNKQVGDTWQVMEILEVAVLDKSFYPKQIKQQEFVIDRRGDPVLVADAEKAAKEPPKPLLPGRVTTWIVREVTAQKAIDPAALALEFPHGATYHNYLDDRYYTVGNIEPDPIPREPLAIGEVAPAWEIASWSDGKKRGLEDLRGQAVLVMFGTNKPEERTLFHATLRNLKKHFAGKPVAVVVVYPPGTDIKAFAESNPDGDEAILLALDSGNVGERGQTAENATIAEGAAMVIDPQGRIAFSTEAQTEDLWEGMFKSAAKELSIPWPASEAVKDQLTIEQHLQMFGVVVRNVVEYALLPSTDPPMTASPVDGQPVRRIKK